MAYALGWGVLVKALLSVGAEALQRRVRLEGALDGADCLAFGGIGPSPLDVVVGGAALALFVEEANASDKKKRVPFKFYPC
jgi:hypothetical protein